MNQTSPSSLQWSGLSAQQVEQSRAKHGANVMTPPEKDPLWKLYLEKFEDPIIRILLIAAVIAIVVGVVEKNYLEGVGIVVAIFLATAIGFWNELKADKEFEILNQMGDEDKVKAVRDGVVQAIPRRDVVVGDILMLEVGEEIPADGGVLDAMGFQVSEACLTGESAPVTKKIEAQVREGERKEAAYPPNQVLRGCMVVDGWGVVCVDAVGDQTEIGKTGKEAFAGDEVETPLNRQLDRLAKLIGVVGFAVSGALFAALVVRATLTGEFRLTGQQWAFFGVLMASAGIALVKVWLPIVYDALDLMGKDKELPAWLEEDGLSAWLKCLGLGAVVFLAGAFGGGAVGLTPPSSADWMPMEPGRMLLEFFMIGVTLIVVAVPEGLPMSVTLSLAYSMQRMAKTNNLVRRMHACETTGATTVICSDKTGTLTRNQMRVEEAAFPFLNGAQGLDLAAEALAVNATAHLSRKDGSVEVVGNPTEGALLLWLESNGQNYLTVRGKFERAWQWTFSTERKFMATLGASHAMGGASIVHLKGAPEILMERCDRVLTTEGEENLQPATRRTILDQLLGFQKRGMRTLGFAIMTVPECYETQKLEDIANNLIWLGFTAILDPLRDEVPEAIRVCSKAGIEVKMITGDNVDTAREIARQAGLLTTQDGDDRVMTGSDFIALDDEAAIVAAKHVKVFARFRPLHKLRVVDLLQSQNEVVSVTGDGINDIAALKQANVGLAMGSGSAAAKEAADIILLDDSFKSIENAVMWGRSLYLNIQKFILFQLTINVAALMLALLGPFIGVPIPLTVTQMLWINLIMDTFAALALATEPPQPQLMNNKPRSASDFIISPIMGRSILMMGGLFVALLAALLVYLGLDGQVDPHELTVFFTAFVMLQVFNIFNAKTLGTNKSVFKCLADNMSFLLILGVIVVGQVLITQFGGEVFRTVPLSLMDWGKILAPSALILVGGEIVRAVKRMAGAST